MWKLSGNDQKLRFPILCSNLQKNLHTLARKIWSQPIHQSTSKERHWWANLRHVCDMPKTLPIPHPSLKLLHLLNECCQTFQIWFLKLFRECSTLALNPAQQVEPICHPVTASLLAAAHPGPTGRGKGGAFQHIPPASWSCIDGRIRGLQAQPAQDA